MALRHGICRMLDDGNGGFELVMDASTVIGDDCTAIYDEIRNRVMPKGGKYQIGRMTVNMIEAAVG